MIVTLLHGRYSIFSPMVLLPNLLHKFKVCGLITNLKINFVKLEAMGVEISHPFSRA